MNLLDRALLKLSSLLTGAGLRIRRSLLTREAPRPRPDDIYIVSYPKSGTTLMQMILYQLTTGGEMDFPHINAVCPFLELEISKHNAGFLEAAASPRCFKTHLLARELPITTGRYIYIVRDVRDVVVSAYHHDLMVGGAHRSLEQFTEEFLESGWLAYPTWFEHLDSWWPHRNDPNVLYLSFEDMTANLEATIRQVARFCQIDVREADMPRILERCSFAFMKQHEAKFDPRLQNTPRGSQGFIRKGKTGSGSELLPRHREMFDEKLTATARKLGCNRGEPYRELVSGG